MTCPKTFAALTRCTAHMNSSVSLLTVILMALLPAIGTIAGLALAEWRRPPRWLTGSALHAAAGFAVAIATLEFLPRAQVHSEGWLIALGFFLGAAGSLGLSHLTGRLARSLKRQHGASGAWGGFLVVLIDLASDGLLTGSGATISRNLGLLLGGSQVIANLPGGFAAAASLRDSNLPKRPRYLAFLVFPITPLITALLGYLVLRDASDPALGFALAALAGLLLLATVEDLVPEADRPGAPRHLSSAAFAAGFISLMLVIIYLGD